MRWLIVLGLAVAACSGSGSDGPSSAGAEGGDGGDASPVVAGKSTAAGTPSRAGESAGAAAGAGGESQAAGAGTGEPDGGAGVVSGGAAGEGGEFVAPGGAAGESVGGGGGSTVCSTATFYLDADHDSFGDAGAKTTACVAPPGYVADATDCDDDNAQAHPGQLEWFAVPRADGSFDYDCDDAEELRYPTFSECPDLDNSCPPPNQWPDGFSCDYLGMMAPYNAQDGWRLYTYSVCQPEPCTIATVKIPACGGVGAKGKPPLGWDNNAKEYTCTAVPYIAPQFIDDLPKRTQTCR